MVVLLVLKLLKLRVLGVLSVVEQKLIHTTKGGITVSEPYYTIDGAKVPARTLTTTYGAVGAARIRATAAAGLTPEAREQVVEASVPSEADSPTPSPTPRQTAPTPVSVSDPYYQVGDKKVPVSEYSDFMRARDDRPLATPVDIDFLTKSMPFEQAKGYVGMRVAGHTLSSKMAERESQKISRDVSKFEEKVKDFEDKWGSTITPEQESAYVLERQVLEREARDLERSIDERERGVRQVVAEGDMLSARLPAVEQQLQIKQRGYEGATADELRQSIRTKALSEPLLPTSEQFARDTARGVTAGTGIGLILSPFTAGVSIPVFATLGGLSGAGASIGGQATRFATARLVDSDLVDFDPYAIKYSTPKEQAMYAIEAFGDLSPRTLTSPQRLISTFDFTKELLTPTKEPTVTFENYLSSPEAYRDYSLVTTENIMDGAEVAGRLAGSLAGAYGSSAIAKAGMPALQKITMKTDTTYQLMGTEQTKQLMFEEQTRMFTGGEVPVKTTQTTYYPEGSLSQKASTFLFGPESVKPITTTTYDTIRPDELGKAWVDVGDKPYLQASLSRTPEGLTLTKTKITPKTPSISTQQSVQLTPKSITTSKLDVSQLGKIGEVQEFGVGGRAVKGLSGREIDVKGTFWVQSYKDPSIGPITPSPPVFTAPSGVIPTGQLPPPPSPPSTQVFTQTTTPTGSITGSAVKGVQLQSQQLEVSSLLQAPIPQPVYPQVDVSSMTTTAPAFGVVSTPRTRQVQVGEVREFTAPSSQVTFNIPQAQIDYSARAVSVPSAGVVQPSAVLEPEGLTRYDWRDDVVITPRISEPSFRTSVDVDVAPVITPPEKVQPPLIDVKEKYTAPEVTPTYFEQQFIQPPRTDLQMITIPAVKTPTTPKTLAPSLTFTPAITPTIPNINVPGFAFAGAPFLPRLTGSPFRPTRPAVTPRGRVGRRRLPAMANLFEVFEYEARTGREFKHPVSAVETSRFERSLATGSDFFTLGARKKGASKKRMPVWGFKL